MDLTNALHRLRHRKLALLAAVILGAAAFVLVTFHVSGSGLERKSTTRGTAQAELLVDAQRSSLRSISNLNGELAFRAIALAQFAQSDSIRKRMAEALDRPRDSFALVSSTSALGGPGGSSTPAANGTDVQKPLPGPAEPAVVFRASGGLPVVRIQGQGRTAEEAGRLTRAARTALLASVAKVGTGLDRSDRRAERRSGDRSYPLLLRPVSSSGGTTVTTASSLGRGVGVGVGVFVVLALLSLAVGRPRRDAEVDQAPQPPAPRGETAAVRAFEAYRHNGHDRELVAAGSFGDATHDDAAHGSSDGAGRASSGNGGPRGSSAEHRTSEHPAGDPDRDDA